MPAERTSLTDPIRVDFVPGVALPGRLGLTFAPGKRASATWGPPWRRDLDLDLRDLRGRWGVDRLVSLIEDAELELLGIPALVARAEAAGLVIHRHPVRDVSIPPDAAAYAALVARALVAIRDGETVVAHCRGGLGRAGTFAACVLRAAGRGGDEAIAEIRAARPKAIETPEQADYVRAFTPSVRAFTP
jgi:protein-tyrosine phosphatase